MSIEQNRSLVGRYYTESVSAATGPDQTGAVSVIDELMTDDFVMAYNNDGDADAMHGRERHKQFLIEHARNFPEDDWTVEAVVADEAVVACRWRFQGIHAKTGNRVDQRAADFFSVRGGRVAELRRFLDFESFSKQLERTTLDGEDERGGTNLQSASGRRTAGRMASRSARRSVNQR